MTDSNLASPVYTVIGLPPTRTIRVIWALEELALPYTIEPARPHANEVSAVNPSGKVPAMLVQEPGHEPFEIIDSVAIVQYLADKHEGLTFPAGTRARALQDSFTHFALDELDGTLWQMAKHTFIWPEGMRHLEAIKPGSTRDLDKAFDSLVTRLGDQEFVAGSQFTVPDIIITHCCGWAQRSDYYIKHARVNDYLTRCHARAAYQRTMEVRSRYL
ncbi:MAG: glutathione S-transferase family protein [Pseudomonadota bacterium]